MDLAQKEKINRFLADKAMAKIVYDVLLQSFLKKKNDADINILASSMLAVYALEDGWKELQKYKNETESVKRELDQIGL